MRITDFTQLVEAALKVERVRINEQSRRDRQQKWGPSQANSSSKPIRSSEVCRLRAIARHRVRANYRGPDLSLHLGEASPIHL